MKKTELLIISSQVPFRGGMSTTAYNLSSSLGSWFDVTCIFFLSGPVQDCDPHNIGNVHTLKMPTTYKANRWFFRFLFLLSGKKVFNISGLNSRNFRSTIKEFLVIQSLNPKIVLCNVPLFFNDVDSIFPGKTVILLVNGCSNLNPLWKFGLDANTLLSEVNKVNGLNRITPIRFPENLKGPVVFNSKLTRDIYNVIGFYSGPGIIKFSNIKPFSNEPINCFTERKYEIAFIISKFNRVEKNAQLALNIFCKFPHKQKLLVGEESYKYSYIPNTTFLGPVTQNEIQELLSNTKLVLITSYFDSSPGLLMESIWAGANVLISENVGWNECLPDGSVVLDYFNLNEWVQKANVLMKEKLDYSEYLSMIKDCGNGIIELIEEEQKKSKGNNQ